MGTEMTIGVTIDDYLSGRAVPRALIDDFLQRPRWSQFDAELGYTLHDCLVQWGIDGSRALATFQPNGARSSPLFGARKPRINSYGDSFTECNQVSDAETWQEYLGGHIGEPIGNFGVGGYGVYQAYLRMLRHEGGADSADIVIFYIWGDDPVRSLMRARWAMSADWHKRFPGNPWKGLFHGNAWANIEMDLESGAFVERPNPLDTPGSLYAMCDPDWLRDALCDDLALQMHLFTTGIATGEPGKITRIDQPKIDRLATLLGGAVDWDAPDRVEQVAALLQLYGQHATTHILDKVRAFTAAAGKRLLVVLNCTARTDTFREPPVPYDGRRCDQLILDHLNAHGFDLFDMNAVHDGEYAERPSQPYSRYMQTYMVGGVGHYNPRGNHLFAYAIKDALLAQMDRKPLVYSDLEDERIDFSGYLPRA